MGRRVGTTFVTAGLVTVLLGCAAQPPASQAPVLSYDGLTPLEDTVMTRVWVREGFRLSRYRQVMLVGAGIQYRPHLNGAGNDLGRTEGEFPLSEHQKLELQRLITEEFDEALQRLKLEEVDEPGPDVLLVRGMMLDVVSRAPPVSATGSGYWLDSIGQATFVVELIDSQSNTVLVRALDSRAAQTPGDGEREDTATNRGQVRRLLARWANMLVDALNDLTAIDELMEPQP